MKWKYKDNRGVWQEGTIDKIVDNGGTDITYIFKQDDGTVDVISGPKLTRDNAGPIY